MKSEDNSFIQGFILNGKGGAKPISQKALQQWTPQKGVLWVHLNLTQPEAIKWLAEQSGLKPWAVELLSNTETSRPRCIVRGDAMLLSLRTINLKPRAEPDDLVFLRLFATSHRLITVRVHPVLNFQEIAESFLDGDGPTDVNSLIGTVLDQTLTLIADSVEDMGDYLDELEEQVIADKINDCTSSQLSELLRQSVVMRRFLYPEREALASLTRQKPKWSDDALFAASMDALHRLERIIEDLELFNERARINQEAINNATNKFNQRNMYLLSVMATIFLPLSFITGLFGMNVGGIPLAASEVGLIVVTALIFGIGLLMVWVLKRMKWI